MSTEELKKWKCDYCTFPVHIDHIKLNGKPIHLGCLSMWVREKEQELQHAANLREGAE